MFSFSLYIFLWHLLTPFPSFPPPPIANGFPLLPQL